MATVLRAHDYIRPVDTTASAETKSAEPERPSAGAHNPYLAARREWDERYGNLITRERNRRRMALICALTCVLLITVVGLAEPFQRTVAPSAKLAPLTTRVKSLPPAPTASGARPVIRGTSPSAVVAQLLGLFQTAPCGQ